MMKDYLLFLTVVSSVCSIVGFVITLFSKYSWYGRVLWSLVIFIMTFLAGGAVHNHSEVERLHNIHRKANAVLEDYNTYGSNEEFIQESLTFLEENKDKYPDAYNRANQIYLDMKESNFQYASTPAYELRGIIRGVAALNGE